MTPISSLKFSNIENYHFFRVSVDQEKKVEKKNALVFRFGVSVFRFAVSWFSNVRQKTPKASSSIAMALRCPDFFLSKLPDFGLF